MATTEDTRTLSVEAAAALLTAIKTAAPSAAGAESLRHLAEAYALVVDGMPKRGRAG